MNVVFIFTDQQSARMMSRAGNRDVNTPVLDALSARGTRFERAYCAQPLCVPSRGAIFTGMYPHEFGVTANDDPSQNIASAPAWLARTLRDQQISTHYIGKWHLPIHIDDAGTHGFDWGTESLDHCIPDIFRASLENASPFFTVISLTNPHDIYAMPFKSPRKLANGPLDSPPSLDQCPELPPNFAPANDESHVLREVRAEQSSMDWTDDDWRVYPWAYDRLTERVDAEIGRIIASLEASRHVRDTVVFFSSDHGESAGSHGWMKKSVLYEESAGVLLITAGPQADKPVAVDNRHLVSTGLDLFPTICDYAGVTPPEHLRGCSIRPLCESVPIPWRNQPVVETKLTGKPDSATGRAIYSDQFKYTIYSGGANHEILINLKAEVQSRLNA